MLTFFRETMIVIDACVAWLVHRAISGPERARQRWNQELDRLVK
jgi:hypothetical protein